MMKTLSKEEKDIIKLINQKKIKDIYSYVRYYNLGIVAQYNEVDIQKAFNERYGNKYYIVKKEEKNISIVISLNVFPIIGLK